MKLSVDKINESSPYWVIQLDDMQFRFRTVNGIVYHVGFYADSFFLPDQAYHFYISNVGDLHAPKDSDVFKVISIILEEFFSQDSSVMLYICDAKDHREAARAELYKRWFRNYEKNDELTLKDADIQFKNSIVYAGMILRNDNPDYSSIVAYFDAFISRIPTIYNVKQK